MSRYIHLFALIVIFASCTRTGYYYTDKQNDEYVSINDDGIKKSGLAAYIVDTNFYVIVFFKLLDTSKSKDFNIDSINLSINNLSSTNAKKSVLFIDSPLKVTYEELADIVNLDDRIHTGLPLEFLYEFNSKDLSDGKRILIKVNIRMLDNGRRVQIEKEFEMVRRSRYRFWLATK
jgi:hypothetical protein